MHKFTLPSNLLKEIYTNRPPAAPLTATIDITSHCNLHCEFCWFHSPLSKARPQLYYIPTAKVIAMINELAAMGTKEICLSGAGEPASHPAFSDIVNTIKNRGIFLKIITNGTIRSPKIAAAYARTDIIVLNLAATDEANYQAIHSPKNSKTFKQLMKNIKLITSISTSFGHPYIEISYVITKNNFRRIDKIIEFARSYGVTSILFKIMQTTPFSKKLALSSSEKKEFIKDIARLLQRPLDIQTNLGDLLSALRAGKSIPVSFNQCFIGWLTIKIRQNGIVGLCCLNNRLKIGNWKKNTIRELWTGDKAQRLRLLTQNPLNNKKFLGKDCRFCAHAKLNHQIENVLKTFPPLKKTG